MTQAPQTSGILAGKRGLVMGVANNRSIAWGIAKAAHDAGAELAFTFQGEALEKRVRPLAAELGAHVVGQCDVTDGASIDAVFAEVARSVFQRDVRRHARRPQIPQSVELAEVTGDAQVLRKMVQLVVVLQAALLHRELVHVGQTDAKHTGPHLHGQDKCLSRQRKMALSTQTCDPYLLRLI
mgnify:CR=1 FL=1